MTLVKRLQGLKTGLRLRPRLPELVLSGVTRHMQIPGSPTSLVVLSYTSRLAPDLSAAATARLAQQAWSFNSRMGLTGMMALEGGRVLQVIEGPCEVVLALSARLLTDRRHSEIAIQRFEAITARSHVGWTATGFFGTPAAEPVAQSGPMPAPTLSSAYRAADEPKGRRPAESGSARP